MRSGPLPSLEEARATLRAATGRGVRIAVLDSGVEASHPGLGGLALADDLAFAPAGLELAITDGRGTDFFGHGTAVASVLRRVAPDATLGSFRVLDGSLASRTAIICEGVRAAIERGYQVLVCSFGCRGVAEYVMPYKAWVDECYLQGRHVVAACNNANVDIAMWPGHFPTVITVNMARAAGDAFYYGPGRLVEFAAAGEQVEVAWIGGGTKRVTGSSYAAPVVAGLLARLLERWPALPPLEAKALLHRLAQPLRPEVAAGNVGR